MRICNNAKYRQIYSRCCSRVINMTSNLPSWWLKNTYIDIQLRQMEDSFSRLMLWLHFLWNWSIAVMMKEVKKIMKSKLSPQFYIYMWIYV